MSKTRHGIVRLHRPAKLKLGRWQDGEPYRMAIWVWDANWVKIDPLSWSAVAGDFFDPLPHPGRSVPLASKEAAWT